MHACEVMECCTYVPALVRGALAENWLLIIITGEVGAPDVARQDAADRHMTNPTKSMRARMLASPGGSDDYGQYLI